MSEPRIVRFHDRRSGRLWRSIRIEGDPDGTGAGSPPAQLRAHFGRKSRAVGLRDMAGLGRVLVSEDTGEDRCVLRVGLQSEGRTFPATKAGVDAHVRRIRPDDLVELGAIDDGIAQAERQLAAARRRRLEFLHDAFQRGHKVPLHELVNEARRRSADRT